MYNEAACHNLTLNISTTSEPKNYMDIPGFSSYSYENSVVTKTHTVKKNNEIKRKEITKQKGDVFKLKGDDGKWRRVTLANIQVLCGEELKLPEYAKKIPFTEHYYADIEGNIYSYSQKNPAGLILSTTVNKSGYPRVKINYKGQIRPVEVHQLMAVTFFCENYVELGFDCMHRDNNKSDCSLMNLKLGTRGCNNKHAYETGVNKGNINGINGYNKR